MTFNSTKTGSEGALDIIKLFNAKWNPKMVVQAAQLPARFQAHGDYIGNFRITPYTKPKPTIDEDALDMPDIGTPPGFETTREELDQIFKLRTDAYNLAKEKLRKNALYWAGRAREASGGKYTTMDLVRAFQRSLGLVVDGKWGSNTQKAWDALLKVKTTPTVASIHDTRNEVDVSTLRRVHSSASQNNTIAGNNINVPKQLQGEAGLNYSGTYTDRNGNKWWREGFTLYYKDSKGTYKTYKDYYRNNSPIKSNLRVLFDGLKYRHSDPGTRAYDGNYYRRGADNKIYKRVSHSTPTFGKPWKERYTWELYDDSHV